MFMPSIFDNSFNNDFMDDFFGNSFAMTPSDEFMKTDIKENESSYEIEIDMPGLKKENVKAELKDGYLTISCESKKENDEKDMNGKYIRRERFMGSCSRSYYVGEDVSQKDIKAKFTDGVLKVSVPKKEPKKAVKEDKYISIEG